jgi:hypothetical protein
VASGESRAIVNSKMMEKLRVTSNWWLFTLDRINRIYRIRNLEM